VVIMWWALLFTLRLLPLWLC